MIPGENDCYNHTWLMLWLFDKVFSKGCHLMCMWMTVAIAVLRYIYVCRQNFNRNLTKKSTSYVIISCFAIGCSVAAVPLSLDKKIVDIGNSTTTKTSPCYNVRDSDLALSNPIVRHYDFWFAGVIMQIIPSLLLSYFTLLLVKQLRKSVTFRQKTADRSRQSLEKRSSDRSSTHSLMMSQTSLNMIHQKQTSQTSLNMIQQKQTSSMEKSIRDNIRTTKMLLAIVICSILSDFPLGVIVMVIYFDDSWYFNVGQHLFNPFMVLIYINNSINIIFYCTMSRPFREEAKELFLPQRLVANIKRIYSKKTSSHNDTDIELW